jgi:hypothetical protein
MDKTTFIANTVQTQKDFETWAAGHSVGQALAIATITAKILGALNAAVPIDIAVRVTRYLADAVQARQDAVQLTSSESEAQELLDVVHGQLGEIPMPAFVGTFPMPAALRERLAAHLNPNQVSYLEQLVEETEAELKVLQAKVNPESFELLKVFLSALTQNVKHMVQEGVATADVKLALQFVVDSLDDVDAQGKMLEALGAATPKERAA